MTVLYNEFDKNAAAWLRELISMGAIADGYVDQRSILELTPSDIRKYRCAHFFAGIGGWSYALRLAGIPDDYPVWTASLPCQPFSCAGKQLGKNDERHLLPHFLELVDSRRPPIIFGEQVPGAIRHGWLDDLCDEMERLGYTVRAAVLSAAGVGAPHIRQRLYWVAFSESERAMREPGTEFDSIERQESADLHFGIGASGVSNGLAHAKNSRRQSIAHMQSAGIFGEALQPSEQRQQFSDLCSTFDGWLPDASSEGLQRYWKFGEQSFSENRQGTQRFNGESSANGRMGDSKREQCTEQVDGCGNEERARTTNRTDAHGGEFQDIDWIYCRDGKYRPIKRGIKPLVARLPGGMVHSGDSSIAPNETAEARAMRLKGYGNAIVPQVAAEFIKAVFETLDLY